MATQSLSLTSSRKLLLAAVLGASALAGVLSPTAASAFGFHGGMGGGFHGGFGGGFHSGFGGGFHSGGFGFQHRAPMHFAGLHDPGFGRHPIPDPRPFPEHPFPPRGEHCRFRCGPIYGGPVYAPPAPVVSTGATSVGYADQPSYRPAMAEAAPSCNAPTGTFVMIGFVPTATASDVAAFLQAYEVAITDGPDKDSTFVIKLSDRKMTDKEIQAEMVEMQAEKSVVRFVGLQGTSTAQK